MVVRPVKSSLARSFVRLRLSPWLRLSIHLRKHLKFIVLVLLATLILWWFGRGLNWTEVRHSLGQADWRLLAASIGFVCVTYLLRAYR